MEAAVDGDGGKGFFATTVDTNDGMVAVALTTTGQLRTTTAIAATTIGLRSHCR